MAVNSAYPDIFFLLSANPSESEIHSQVSRAYHPYLKHHLHDLSLGQHLAAKADSC